MGVGATVKSSTAIYIIYGNTAPESVATVPGPIIAVSLSIPRRYGILPDPGRRGRNACQRRTEKLGVDGHPRRRPVIGLTSRIHGGNADGPVGHGTGGETDEPI